MTIGEKIKELRIMNNMTQKQLGELIDLSPKSITLFETGKRTPNKQNIEKICSVFKVPIYYFYDELNVHDISTINDINNKIFSDFGYFMNKINLLNSYTVNSNEEKDTLKFDYEIYSNNFISQLNSFINIYSPNISILLYKNSIDNETLKEVISCLEMLNEHGHKEALNRINEMTLLKKYTDCVID